MPQKPLEEILRPNDLLRSHPMMTPEFIKKGSRKVGWEDADVEFAELYAKMQELEPEVDWSYPPDLSAMDDPSYWGLPEGWAKHSSGCNLKCFLLADASRLYSCSDEVVLSEIAVVCV